MHLVGFHYTNDKPYLGGRS